MRGEFMGLLNKTLVNFVAKPELIDTTTTQTGDVLWWLILALVIFASIATLAFCYRSFKNLVFINGKHAKVGSLMLVKCKNPFLLLCVSLVLFIMLIFGCIVSAFAFQPNYKASDSVNVYVNKSTGEIDFSEAVSKISNNDAYDFQISGLSISKCEGISDGDCTWTVKHDNNKIFEEVSDGQMHALENDIVFRSGCNTNLHISCDIDLDTAISLIDKSVVELSYNAVFVNPQIIWDESTANIKCVKDISGNEVSNGSPVAPGTKLQIIPSETITSENFTVSYQDIDMFKNNLEVKEYPTKDGAYFIMSDYSVEVSADFSDKAFFAEYNTETNTLTINYNNSQPDSFLAVNDIIVYKQDLFDFDAHKVDSKLPKWPWSDKSAYIKNINISSGVESFYGLRSTCNMFSGPEEVSSLSGFEYLQMENVTDLSSMFENTALYGSADVIPNVSNWNLNSAIDMSRMFYCFGKRNEHLTKSLDVGDWNVSSVTDMSNMFGAYGCWGTVSKCPNVAKWDVSNVKNMSYMFYGYASNSTTFNDVPYVKDWDVSHVVDMSFMFEEYARSSEIIDFNLNVADWDVSSVENLSGMFLYCCEECRSKYAKIPDVTHWNVAKVQNFSEFFYWGFRYWEGSIDLSTWDTTACTSYENAIFLNLKQITIGPKWTLLMSKCGQEYPNWKIDGKEFTLKEVDTMITNGITEPVTLQPIWHNFNENKIDGIVFNDNYDSKLDELENTYTSFNCDSETLEKQAIKEEFSQENLTKMNPSHLYF